MASKFLRLNRNFLLARPTSQIPSSTPSPFRQRTLANDLSNHTTRPFSLTARQSIKVDSDFISQITAAEKKITGSDQPVKNGPTAKAQAHVGQDLTAQIIHDITLGEKTITGSDEPFKGGPTAFAQSALTNNTTNSSASDRPSGTLDSNTLHKITEAEKKITGQSRPVKDGPAAHAQSHAKEPITSQALHDITVGEKKITGGERVKGGPTATAQSELSRSRS
ncbi:hypothetical protein yc1106_05576 [Curvularia clavata]|uniref:Uncharacterized protein n=1 Tax=Curvularia clavata TaxID=95742 RepID=A0A9Q8Z9Z9_CURCL|nr:hypothetical protein yc1106_05576 [Curvularia clavata]